ncbi:hypothetical protein IC582_000107 [Cucumis melo]
MRILLGFRCKIKIAKLHSLLVVPSFPSAASAPELHAVDTSDSIKEPVSSTQHLPSPITIDRLATSMSEPSFTTRDALDKFQVISQKGLFRPGDDRYMEKESAKTLQDVEEVPEHKGLLLSRTPIELKGACWSVKVVLWIGGRILSMTHLPSGIQWLQGIIEINGMKSTVVRSTHLLDLRSNIASLSKFSNPCVNNLNTSF